MRRATAHQPGTRYPAEAFKTATSRKRFTPRKKPYFLQIAPGVSAGYLRRADPKPGGWYGRRETDRKRSGQYHYAEYDVWRLDGVADDLPAANGATVISYATAVGQVTQQAGDRGSGRTQGRYTVARAIADYLVFRQGTKGESSARYAEGSLGKHVTPHAIAEKDLNALTLGDLHAWQAGMVRQDADDPDLERRTKDTANRVMRDLKALLNYAVDNKKRTGVLSGDEWGAKFEPLKYGNANPGKPREYHFDIPTALRVIEAAAPDCANLLRAAFYSGARPGDLMKLRVKDFRPAHRELTIPKGKTPERTTTLTTEAVEFFRSVAKNRLPTAPLLTQADGTRWTPGAQTLPVRVAVLASGLVTAQELRAMPKRERPCLYSFRHTYISRSIEQGVPLLLIAQNVGNSVAMVEKHYAKIIERTRRDLIEKGAPSLRLREVSDASA